MLRKTTLIALLFMVVAGCGPLPEDGCELAQDRSPLLSAEAGFTEIEPITFQLSKGQDVETYTSSTARLWTMFQPADDTPEDKPLVVLFNGGPGASTSSLLFAFNTARLSFDPVFNGGVEIGEDPAAWTRFANLLYIDARNAGFSYSLMEDPQDVGARADEFSTQNHNPFIDAADFLRVVLRFLEKHPSIQGNPVILAGESYGGLRSTVMLHILLHTEAYTLGQTPYEDQELMAEIEHYFRGVDPHLGWPIPAEVVAKQFPGQILIQPLLAAEFDLPIKAKIWEQEDSVIFRIADETHTHYVPCTQQPAPCNPISNALDFVANTAGRDTYHFAMPADWTTDLARAAGASLVTWPLLSRATGFGVDAIHELYAQDRAHAYRIGDPSQLQVPVDTGDFDAVFGQLESWDGYHVFLNDFVWWAFHAPDAYRFEIAQAHRRYGAMFLENAMHINVFLTNAPFDLHSFSEAQWRSLGEYTGILDRVSHDEALDPHAARPGWIHLDYLPALHVGRRTIRFPLYEKSGHAVELSQPVELRDDVDEWLREVL